MVPRSERMWGPQIEQLPCHERVRQGRSFCLWVHLAHAQQWTCGILLPQRIGMSRLTSEDSSRWPSGPCRCLSCLRIQSSSRQSCPCCQQSRAGNSQPSLSQPHK